MPRFLLIIVAAVATVVQHASFVRGQQVPPAALTASNISLTQVKDRDEGVLHVDLEEIKNVDGKMQKERIRTGTQERALQRHPRRKPFRAAPIRHGHDHGRDVLGERLVHALRIELGLVARARRVKERPVLIFLIFAL